MTISDIIIGKRYVHSHCGPGCVWLGIGLRKLYTEDTALSKHLVCIVNTDADKVGWMVQEGENAAPGWWDGFQDADGDALFLILSVR